MVTAVNKLFPNKDTTNYISITLNSNGTNRKIFQN